MKAFLKGLCIVVALTVGGMVFATTFPEVGLLIGPLFLLVPLIAIFKPLPQIYLGNRAFSASVAFFVGLVSTTLSYGAMLDAQGIAELRAADPTAYLTQLEVRDRAKWILELEELDPERYAIEKARIAELEAKRRAETEAAEARIKAEAEAAAAERRAEAEAKRQAGQVVKVSAYIEQLDREIASIPGVKASKYTGDIAGINTGLVLIGAWALLFEEGENLSLTEEARQKREQFRKLLVNKQVELLPALRDAYGPIMRRELWEVDGSARTIGAGYRTVEFVSTAFVRNAGIQQIHSEIRENLMMLRFTRAQYKWFKEVSEYSYYTLEVPKDSEIVRWQSGGSFRKLE
ncbi:hypothetical protein PVW53_14020 [Seohaeicola sp. SP36]|uniref:hypothetical protein n=1 Tax=unclassified Seohaeicola TaxID=2641111 RepID=UPI00237C220F|nr:MULTISPECIES: hypothetical protein [unclassified Seohaeicola]MDD9709715.1 hypothetical protein [Seohaeicola sp. 4SK31]MDD9736647.1 hypothetical protein [Seohaeicola sp. SP36]